MTKLRELTAVFIWILVVAFVGLMVFEWGMDFTGLGSKQKSVGSVNGQELTYQMFSDMYQQLYQATRENSEKELEEEQLKNLRTQVWEQFVQRVLFTEEMEKLEITISDPEILYQIKHYPLDQIKSNPGFQTNGEFDTTKYYASFNNPEIPWLQIEEYYRNQVLPFQKLQNIISSTVRVSRSEIEEEIIKNEQKARVVYLHVPYANFNDPQMPVSDEDIEMYYQENLQDFQKDETRKISYVLFPLTPSSKDTARIYSDFNEIKRRLANGENFNDLADIYSEDPAKESNHGKYDYFERGAMVKPFEDASFNGKVGELVGPVETRYGLHLIKIEGKRLHEGKEQVSVSHILLKITAGPSTREKMENESAFFAEDARAEGYEKIAAQNGFAIDSTNEFSEAGNFVPGFGRNFNILNFTFRGNLGDISDVIDTDNGFAVFKITKISEAGPKKLEDVANIIKSRIRLENAKEKTEEFAAGIKTKLENNLTFAKIAADDQSKVVKMDTTSLFSLKSSIPGIGFDHIFNAAAFSLEPGEMSDIIRTNRGLFWEELLEKTKVDSTILKAQSESVRGRLLVQKKSQVFNSWYEYLKENADIVDHR